MASRAPAEAAAAPAEARAAPTPSRHRESPRVRTALKVSSPSDPAEREAEATAKRVMRMPAPARLGPIVARAPLQPARAPAIPVPRPQAPPGAAAPPAKARPPEETSPELEAAIKKEKGGGRPLPADVAAFMGPRFKADFSGVRIHTGARAENLTSRLGARAFAFGRDIFFNAGQFKPATPEGMELIAHELTHTIQQREVVQREVAEAAPVEVRESSEPQVQRGVVGEALDWVADKANMIPGFRLFTIVIGRNPVNMAKVDRSGANILRALIEFIPGGGLIVQALENHGVFEKGGKFIEEQFAALGDLAGAVRDALMEFIDSLGISDIFRLGSLWERAKRIFTVPVDKVISFGKNLVSGVAEIVKDAIVKPLGRWAAANIPKWDLLVGVFGKNPISGEGASPAAALIGGFMELIGQKEIWENIKQANAVAKAWQWFQGAMKGALALVTSIPGRVMDTIRSLTIFDIVTIVGAFGKILGAFSSFIGDFIRWAGGTVLSLLEIIFSVVAPTVVPYLKKAGGAFSKIIKSPGTFISTLVKAGKQGFNQFKAKIVAYLRDALFKWLLGSAEGAGLYFPKSFAPLELLKLGLSVLGLTWAHVRGKLVAATNETTVKAMETGFDLVKTLVTQGPAAAWQELLNSLSNLKAMVIDAAIDFVKGEVVKIAIEKLVSFLTPAGAFVQAILSIYRTIMFIVQKLAQIGRLVAAFVDGLAALADGVVTTAAGKVESVLAQGLSLAISFLASFAGLGNVPKKVMELIKKIRAPVDKAINAVIKWIVDKARKLGRFVAQAGVPHDPHARLRLATGAAVAAARSLRGTITAPVLEAAYGAIKVRYGLTAIRAFQRDDQWFVRATINPELEKKLPTPDEAAKKILDLAAARTKMVDIVSGGAGRLVYTAPIKGYRINLGNDTDFPSIQKLRRPSGLPPLPDVHLESDGTLALGAKVHQKRSSEADKLKMYRDVISKLKLGSILPEITKENVTPAKNSAIRGAMRKAILDSDKYQTLPAFNAMISSGALTGPGMQGELFEAWIVKHFGDKQGISDAKIKYKTPSGVGLMDRSAGTTIVEIKSRTRPGDIKPDIPDDAIPSTKFAVAGKDADQFVRYGEILKGNVEMITKSAGSFVVPAKFTGVRYYFNFLGCAKLFAGRMPASLKAKTTFYVGGVAVTL